MEIEKLEQMLVSLTKEVIEMKKSTGKTSKKTGKKPVKKSGKKVPEISSKDIPKLIAKMSKT